MEGEAILNLQIEVNDELKSFILKYTDQLTVLEPEYLKNKIYEVLKSSLQHYDHQIG
jgi:predicted DNA-binding transcriptional regulator YafY